MKASSKKGSPSSFDRKARRSAQRRSRERAKTLRVLAIVGVLAALVVIGIVITNNQRAGTAAGGAIEGLRTFSNLAREHSTAPVSYPQDPPVGGPHHPSWQNCGVYTQPIPNENAVHSLEHGVVWITYQPDLPESEVQKLQDLTRQSGYRLLSPYPDLPAPIVLSAWGYQLQLEQADDPRVGDFIRAYEQNPQGPEPGAPCTGGVGQPG
jgi:hypothetical protein